MLFNSKFYQVSFFSWRVAQLAAKSVTRSVMDTISEVLSADIIDLSEQSLDTLALKLEPHCQSTIMGIGIMWAFVNNKSL